MLSDELFLNKKRWITNVSEDEEDKIKKEDEVVTILKPELPEFHNDLVRRLSNITNDSNLFQFQLDKSSLEMTENSFHISIINQSDAEDLRRLNFSFYEQGILRISISDHINDQMKTYNNFPQMRQKKFKIEVGDNYIVVPIENCIEYDETSYIHNKFLKKEFDSIVIRVYLKPIEIEYINGEVILQKINLSEVLEHNCLHCTHYNVDYCCGIPEHMTKVELEDDNYILFNTDEFGYNLSRGIPLYGSIPLMHTFHRLDILQEKRRFVSSLLLDNPSRILINLKTDSINNSKKYSKWLCDWNNFEFYLFSDYIENIFFKLCKITGFTYFPPLNSLGYHHSRYGYQNFEDALNTLIKFDVYDIPLDFFWLDIDHTEGKKYFTWNSENGYGEENLSNFFHMLKIRHRNLVTIIDPHFSTDKNYYIGSSLVKNGLVVLNKDKNPYIGECWPGESFWADFLNKNIQKIFNDFYKYEIYFKNQDFIHTWNDMNEPSVFNREELGKTFPMDNLHFDGNNFVEHSQIHNIYGQYNHKISNIALSNRYNNKSRVFVLSRSIYTGSQQFGFHWTGDNTATIEHLKYSLDMLSTLSYCGISLAGADVGGFNKDCDCYLLAFWHEVGIFYPFFRAHSNESANRREPWKFSDHSFERIRNAVKLRYNLLLYIYTQVYINSLTGRPLLSKVDKSIYSFVEDFYFVINYDKSKSPKYKKFNFYNFTTGHRISLNGSKRINMKKPLCYYIREGIILPWINKPT